MEFLILAIILMTPSILEIIAGACIFAASFMKLKETKKYKWLFIIGILFGTALAIVGIITICYIIIQYITFIG